MNRSIILSHESKLVLWSFFQVCQRNLWHSRSLAKSIFLLVIVLPLIAIINTYRAQAQIAPAPDGTGTLVTPNGNRIDISGGQLSGDKANLFHSFTQFGLNAEQIANFLTNPSIQNILGRIVGGDPSVINGLIQVTGGNSNLFLMNPAGIVFGPNASLNVTGAFTATTANGIGFGSNWFSASGPNNYTALVGNPSTFNFSMSQPGAIINAANLTLGEGQNLTLLGGTVASTGTVSAPGGQIMISAVPGEKLVRLSQTGSPLSLEFQPLPQSGNQPQAWNLPILSLPQLLTAGGGGNANKLTVNNDGTVQISGSGIAVGTGDVAAGNVTAKTATLWANRNLTLVESQLRTTGDLNLLAQDTVQVRDSVANSFIAQAGEKLYLQGNQSVDIFALNHPASGLFSSGDMVLRSSNTVGGDAHFTADGNFRIEKLDGNLGGLFSPYDPVVRASGDVSFQSYTGASLHILARGSVNIPDGVTITARETLEQPFINENVTLSDGTTISINGNRQPTLDIRAGTIAIGTPPGISGSTAGFSPGAPDTSGTETSADITIGNITVTNDQGNRGVVFLTNQYNPNTSLPGGSITTGQINASGGSVTIDARNNIRTPGISTRSDNSCCQIRNIKLISTAGDINVSQGTLDSSSTGYGGGAIALNANGNITTGNITSTGGDLAYIDGNTNNGTITITSNSGFVNVGNLTSTGANEGGAITLNANSNITTNNIDTSGSSGGTISISSNAGTVNVTGTVNSSSTAGYGGGAIALDAGGDITTNVIRTGSDGGVNKADVSITSRNGSISINNPDSDGNSVVGRSITLNAPGALRVAGSLNARRDGQGNAGNITIGRTLVPSSITVGTISTRNRGDEGGGGNIEITTSGTFNATGAFSISDGLPVNSIAPNSVSISSEAFSDSGGTINITANGGITTGAGIASNSRSSGNGGNITLTSNNGAINTGTGTLNSSSGGTGGAIALNANSNITTGDINSDSGGNGGGAIAITSNTGSVSVGNLDSSSNDNGGVIALNANSNITTGNIDTSGFSAGGAVTINSGGNVRVNSINTRGTYFLSSPGGSVNITANGVIQGTGVIPSAGEFSSVPANTTIFTQGTTPGTISIQHSGGTDNVPFSVGDAAVNGTAGAINAGGSSVISASPVNRFPVLPNGGRGTPNESLINITSVNSPPTLTATSLSISGQKNLPFTITYADLNPVINDVNGDNRVIRIDSIPAGTLRRNGNDVVAGSILSPGDRLEYTPQQGATGNVNVFTISASDGVSSSTPSNITVNFVNTPPTLTANSQLTGATANQPLTITYSDLNPRVNDVNGDRTFVRIDAIPAGTLRRNGNDVVAGTILSPNDRLEYIPPQNATGSNVNALIISASDGDLSSPQIPINVQVAPVTLPRPEDPGNIQRNTPPTVAPTLPGGNPTPLVALDPAVAGIDDKFTNQFASHLGLEPRSERQRRISLEETRDILLKIEKETGVKPAIIYVSFAPSGGNETSLQTEQDTDQLDLLIVTRKGAPIRKSVPTAKRAEVLQVAQQLRYAVNEEESTDNNDYLAPAQQLYKWMVEPLEAELKAKGINNLLFITDEGLRSVPLAALHDGKQFLVEKYSVGFTPSLYLTDTRYVSIKNSQVLAMGASKFQDQAPPLPAVPQELSIVAQDIWRGKFFLNQNFTLNNLKSLRKYQPYGIIHLATHGKFEAGTLDNSYIQLWDSKLRLSQLRDLELDNPTVELLVLSACETASGKGYEEAELGFGGVAAKAGVKTALASLWEVSDAGTLGLMTEFYKNLKTAPIKAEALRQAQIAMLKGQVRLENGQLRTSLRGVSLPSESPDAKRQKVLTHPFYWAAFTMIGSPW